MVSEKNTDRMARSGLKEIETTIAWKHILYYILYNFYNTDKTVIIIQLINKSK